MGPYRVLSGSRFALAGSRVGPLYFLFIFFTIVHLFLPFSCFFFFVVVLFTGLGAEEGPLVGPTQPRGSVWVICTAAATAGGR